MTVKYFVPGKYNLVDGHVDLCGEGHFSLRENGSNLNLGPRHGIDTIAKTSKSYMGDAPSDKGCSYQGENNVSYYEDKTTLTFTDIRKCQNVEKHKLTKTVIISKNIIQLNVIQAGEPSFEYSCEWHHESTNTAEKLESKVGNP